MTDNEIIALARGMSIAHYRKPRRLTLSIRGRGRILLRLALAVLFALVVWLALATLANAAARPPLCERSMYSGVRTPHVYTLGYVWRRHVDMGAKPATWNVRRQRWECK